MIRVVTNGRICCLLVAKKLLNLTQICSEAVEVGHETLVSSPGDDKYGRKLIVFSSCCLPPSHQLNHRRLLEYVVMNGLIRRTRLLSLSSPVCLSPPQVSEVHAGPVCGGGLHTGLLPLWSEEQQQAVSEMVTRSVRRVRQKVRPTFLTVRWTDVCFCRVVMNG